MRKTVNVMKKQMSVTYPGQLGAFHAFGSMCLISKNTDEFSVSNKFVAMAGAPNPLIIGSAMPSPAKMWCSTICLSRLVHFVSKKSSLH